MTDEKQASEPTPKTQQTQPKKGEAVEIPVPRRSTWDRVLKRATKPQDEATRDRGDGHG